MRHGLAVHLLAATLLIAMTGCGSRIAAGTAQSGPTWPPSESKDRTASDDAPFFHGDEFSEAGGANSPAGTDLVLGPAATPSWAIYSLQGFGPGTDLDKLQLDFTVTPGSPDQNTKLYVALANYTTDTWEWIDAAAPTLSLDLQDFGSYYSPSGSVHLACVLTGNGSAKITGLRFWRVGPGAAVPVPQNLQGTATPGNIAVSWEAVPHVDGYNIYRGLTNDFASAAMLNGTPLTTLTYNDATVIKNTDYYYWVTALSESESAPSVPLQVTAADTAVATPQNLKATANVDAIHLSWNAANGATSYEIVRSQAADFSSPTTFTNILGTSYTDSGITPSQQVYYYEVIGVGPFEESAPSGAVNIFVPALNLFAPTNFTVDASKSDGDFVKFTWTYSAVDPTNFVIYLHRDPNFALDANLLRTIVVPGNLRSRQEFDLPGGGGTYYCRIAAQGSQGRLGRMTDAISFTNHQALVFEPQEDLGINSGSLLAAAADDAGGVGLAYFNGTNVQFASRSPQGTWTVGQDVGLNGAYGAYLDMAYGAGNYCIGVMQTSAGDCWASVGNGATWNAKRIHGDGSTGQGHQVSGQYVTVTASDTEFAVAHAIDTGQVEVHTTLNGGGSWTSAGAFTVALPTDLSLAYLGGNLYLAGSDYVNGNLLVGDRAGGYNMVPVNQVPGDFTCQFNALQVKDGNLFTPCADYNSPGLYDYRYDGSAWQRDSIFNGFATMSHLDMAISGSKALITYLSPTQSRWFQAYFDGTEWGISSVVTSPATPLNELRPTFLSTGEPYIVFADSNNDLHGAVGAIP